MLQRFAVPSYGPWYLRQLAGITTLTVGFIALIIGYWMQFGGDRAITTVPNLAITLPLLTLTVAAGVVSLLRGERQKFLPILGMAMAAAATVLGWLILVAAIAAVAVLVILIFAKLN